MKLVSCRQRRRFGRGLWTVLAVAACALGAPGCVVPAADESAAGERDDYLDGKADDTTGTAAPVVYRMTDVRVREPHFFVRPLMSCTDLTDRGAFGQPSINAMLNGFVAADDPDEPDGLLDLSLLVLFRPFDPRAASGRLDFGSGECSAPAASTECDLDPEAAPTKTRLVNRATGTCLAPEASHLSPLAYSPRPATVAGPCFATDPFDATLRLGLVDLPLQDVTLAASYAGGGLGAGSLRGFLAEREADARRLPADLPVVGGQPISTMFPGGAGSCATHDDRDVHDGQRGWWLYVDFRAARVPYVGP